MLAAKRTEIDDFNSIIKQTGTRKVMFWIDMEKEIIQTNKATLSPFVHIENGLQCMGEHNCPHSSGLTRLE